MSRAPKSINSRQLRALYWPTWGKARKVLLANHYSADEAEETRKEILQSQGVESSKHLNNRQLDEVLKAHAAIATPTNGKRQAELADQPLNRVRFRIKASQKELGYGDEYVEAIAQQMFRRPIAQLDEKQLIKVSQALQVHLNKKAS